MKARRPLPVGVLEQITVTCLAAPVTLPPGMTPAYPVRGRYHAEMQVAGRCVHIEGIAQELGGPGGTNKEVRVNVEGVLEGRSILPGRLGGNANTYPVVTAIDAGVAMRVTPAEASLRELRVELRQCRSEEEKER